MQSNPNSYTSDFNFTRAILLTLGVFPRGRAKAPKIVLPPEVITTDALYHQLENAYKSIEEVAALSKDAHFKHYRFGTLSKKQTIRFLEIHTKHHVKIIRDILKK